MGLSIKNDEVEQLVRKIAAETGEGITETIRTALEEHLEKIRRAKRGPRLFDEIRSISKRCSALPTLDTREADEILGYDDRGVW
jgi:antitoxin VapB